MKHLYILILVLLSFAFKSQAQVTIYHENFSGTVNGVTGVNWTLSNSNPSNTTQSSGGNNYATSTTSPQGYTAKTLTLNNSINTLGFKNITVTWRDYFSALNNGQSTTMNGQPVKFYYSINGGAYVEVTGFTQNPGFDQWAKINGGNGIVLPAACNDVANIKFYWSVANNNKHGDFYAIDDITITGTPEDNFTTPENDLSILNWANYAGQNPFAAGKTFAVDENVVTFSKTSGTGVTLTKSTVLNTDFQAPAYTLTLVQTGASSTVGTNVKMSFSSPVADLTFTMFDVDQVNGQFKDNVVIKGIGYTGQVLLAKKKVITTYNNTFASASSSIAGVSGTDVAATSKGGNVTVTFSEPVGEVTIEYYNQDAAKGNQGIGLHNLYWRRERSVTTLPVELMFFKGAVQGANANLTWATAQESNNDKFIVERSLDGKSFSAIGEVKGHGNSSTRINYTFTDTNPAEGVNYYRLRQVDLDRAEEISSLVALQFKGLKHAMSGNLARVFPTIAAHEVTVSLSLGNAQVTVLDAAGRQVAQYSNASNAVVVPTAHLNPGIYFVKVSDGSQQQTQRFVKQ